MKISLEEQLKFLGFDLGSLHRFSEDMVRACLMVITARNMSHSVFHIEKNMSEVQFAESLDEILSMLGQAHKLIADMRNVDCFALGESETEPEPKTKTDLEREAVLAAIEAEAISAEERVRRATTNRHTRPSGAAPQDDV